MREITVLQAVPFGDIEIVRNAEAIKPTEAKNE
jgi:hypothetical protein